MRRNFNQILGAAKLEKTGVVMAGIGLTVLLAAGCASNDNYAAKSAPVYTAPASTEVASTPSKTDLEINRAIYDMFMEDRALAAYRSDLVIQVLDGTVTLRGYAPTKRESARIAERIQGLPGVNRVVNEATISFNR
jgi:hypothetical protein